MPFVPFLGPVRGGAFLAGMVATVVGAKVTRTILVGVARAGYRVADGVADGWNTAKSEAQRVRNEARTVDPAAQAELQRLRAEADALKARKK